MEIEVDMEMGMEVEVEVEDYCGDWKSVTTKPSLFVLLCLPKPAFKLGLELPLL